MPPPYGSAAVAACHGTDSGPSAVAGAATGAATVIGAVTGTATVAGAVTGTATGLGAATGAATCLLLLLLLAAAGVICASSWDTAAPSGWAASYSSASGSVSAALLARFPPVTLSLRSAASTRMAPPVSAFMAPSMRSLHISL